MEHITTLRNSLQNEKRDWNQSFEDLWNLLDDININMLFNNSYTINEVNEFIKQMSAEF